MTAYDDAVRAAREDGNHDAAANRLLAQLTGDERLGLLDGDGDFWPGVIAFYTSGYNTEPIVAGAVPRLGIPGVRFSDGPRGAVIGHSTCFPVSMARGASWDIDLEQRIGEAIGAEIRAQGGNLFAGVCVNLLRHPAWGRAQETYGEDPLLLGELGAALTRGSQRHVMACVKHFACNSMENARFTVDVTVDEATLHEVYLPHFKRVIDEGVASVMSAYNSVNGEYCGDNASLLTGILRDEWSFDGFVLSDFMYGSRKPVESVRAGLDIEMPFRGQRTATLRSALGKGTLRQEDVDRAAHRILATLIQFEAERTEPPPTMNVVASSAHRALAREAASRSMVLLRNERIDGTPLLPLSATGLTRVAVIGRIADIENTGDRGSSHVRAPEVSTPLDGLRNALPDVEVTYDDGRNVEDAAAGCRVADVVVLVVGYTFADEGEFIDDSNVGLVTALFPRPTDPGQLAAFLAAQASAPLGGDRRDLRLSQHDEQLITEVSAANPRTIVAIVAGSAVIVDPWHEAPAAIVMAWYSGMEGGAALADVLLGTAEPGGRLPFVVPRTAGHLPAFDSNAAAVTYDRWHGYRKLERDGNEPRYPFGFGLGYSTYSATDLHVAQTPGGLSARAAITNTGARSGSHVLQFYGVPLDGVRAPGRVLLGFTRVQLDPGQRTTVTVVLSLQPLASWDATAKIWRPFSGPLQVELAAHHGDHDAAVTKIEIQADNGGRGDEGTRHATPTLPASSD